MKKFLEELANEFVSKYGDNISDCTIIFPNKRAGLFLKKELSQVLQQTIWAPNILSMEEYFLHFSKIKKTDSLSLIFELYQAFKKNQIRDEGFEKFYFWGEMLLRDFQEVDHYLVDPKQLFKYIKDDKQIAEDFDFLADQPDFISIIQEFWSNFFPDSTPTQQEFLKTWEILLPVYENFKTELINKKIGYSSLIYRELYNELKIKKLTISNNPIIFVGLNALSPVEESLVKYFIVNHNAKVYWDIDAFYLENKNQEAGSFLRTYQKDQLFGQFFNKDISKNLEKPKKIKGIGVPLEIGQTKLLGQQINKLITEENVLPEEIVIVLPQDYLLFPVLNSLPETIPNINVTMGYALKDTPIYSLLELCIDLQEHLRTNEQGTVSFYYKQVLEIFRHPYLFDEFSQQKTEDFISNLRKNNQIRIDENELKTIKNTNLNQILRKKDECETLALYLQKIVDVLILEVTDRFGLEQQFLLQFRQMLARLNEILSKQNEQIDIKIFKSLFSKTARTVKVPFSGEPVLGLQIMGALETRNLDFKYVFFLDLNEKLFPSPPRQGSFIPFRIRIVFGLPTFKTQDAIFAYIFFRLIQRTSNFNFYFNTISALGMSGETSRFIKQLEVETPHKVEYFNLTGKANVRDENWIEIAKTPEIIQKLEMYYCKGGKSSLSASAINSYLYNPMHFYFRYILRIFEPDEIMEDLDARDFGLIMHTSLELLYLDLFKKKGERLVQETDFFGLKNSIKGALMVAFEKHNRLDKSKKKQIGGRNLVLFDIMEKYLENVLEFDRKYAPFTIQSLEEDNKRQQKLGDYSSIFTFVANDKTTKLKLKGIIDRVDEKDGVIRIIDYKTGKDKTNFKSIESLFNSTYNDRNKAVFQLIYYSWLYANKKGMDKPIMPCLLNIQEIFKSDFDARIKINNEPINDIRSYLAEFEQHLTQLLQEIFDLETPFKHPGDEAKDTYFGMRNILKF